MPRAPLLAAAASAAGARGALPAETVTVTLNNGVELPQITLGTFKYDNDTAAAAIAKGFKTGFASFISAYHYNNQWGVAKALKTSGKARDEYFLTTMTEPCNLQTAEACYNFTKGEIEANLQVLEHDYVDLLLIHGPATGPARGCDTQECTVDLGSWRAYEEAYKAGKAKAIGVSNFCEGCIQCLLDNATVPPAVNQVQFHLGDGDDPDGLVSYCAKKGVVLQAYSPLATGFLATNNDTAAIGAAHQKTAAQVALKWVTEKGLPLCVKANDEGYLAQDLDMYSWNLTEAETVRLSGMNCTAAKLIAPYCWPSWACGTHPIPPPSNVA